MANLDPLKFYIAIQNEDAIGKLNELQEKFNSLKSQTIKVNVEGLNELRELLKVLNQNKSNIGENVAGNADKMASALKKSGDELKKQESSLVRISDALGRVRSSLGGSSEGVPFLDSISRVGERNIQTLIKEQGHIERLIAIAKKSIDFGEGHPVLGMGRLRGDQMRNLQDLENIKKAINNILYAANQGDQAMIRFLNTSGSLRTTPFSKDLMGNDITLLGGHFDNLTHSVTNTSMAMRQLEKDMRLDFAKGSKEFSTAADDATWAKMKQQAAAHESAGNAAKAHQRRLEELTSAFAQHDAQVAKSQRVQENDNKARRENAEAMRRQAQELVKARMEMLKGQSSSLSKLLSDGKGTLGAGDYDAVRNALRSVREEMRQIESVMQRIGSYSTRELFGIGRGSGMDYSPLISSTQRLIAAKEQAARASQQMTSEEQRLAQAMNQTTQAAHGQSQVMSDLKSMAMQYLGVWGGQQFINNIIQIGGQLEMQRLSIGAILQDTAHANELFEKIKGLATQSPFGVVQLDQMTKQLTAYGFKYNELYDMTKRLADISAATGTGVDRLALALGHVRSEAALSGYTLRQFSMANVPLLAKLSDKLGKTTKEIRDMVRKKEIGYEDVVGVLKDLTDEGGMFHNMQEVISESVKAKFKNVKDAMDIMYGEMAEGAPGDALKEVANVLMELTRGWKDVATVLGTVTVLWGAHKAAVMLNAKVMGEQNARTIASISAFRAKEAAMLKTATTYRTLTAAESSQIATSKLLTTQERIRMALHIPLTANQKLRIQYARQQYVSDLKVAVAEKKLTTEYILKQVALGKLTKAEAAQILTGNAAALSALNNTKALGAWRRATLSLTLGITKLGAALKSLLLNPAMLGMAGITAVMELWQRNSRELERAKELNDDIYNRSQEGLKNTRLMMQNTGIRVDWRKNEKDEWSDVTGTFGQQFGGIERFVKPEFDKNKDIDGTIDEWMQYIRDYAATPNRIINAAMSYTEKVRDEDGAEKEITKIRERREQYDLLYESVIKVSQAQRQMQSLGDAMEFSTNETNGGWLDKDLLTNIGNYDEQVKKVSQSIAKTYGTLRQEIDKTIRKAQAEDKEFAKDTKGLDNYAQAFEKLVKEHQKYPIANKIFENASDEYKRLLDGRLFDSGTMSGLNNAKKTMERDLNQFFTSLENQLRTKKDWNIDDVIAGKMTLSEDKQQALLSSWKDTLSKVPRLTDETARELTEKFAERYHIQIDAETENAIVKLSQLEQSLNNLVNGDYKVNVDTMTNAKSVFDQLKKDYKAAKEYVEQSKPILAKFGISLTGKSIGITKIDDIVNGISDKGVAEEVRKVLVGYDEAIAQLNKAQEGADNLGLKLDDDKKGKKKSGSTKAYKDEFAKRWDERIRIMKEAHDWYRKWEKEVGHDEAIKETFAKYQDIFKEWKEDKILPLDFDVNDIDDFQKYVEKIYKDALDRYNKQKNNKLQNYGQEAQRVYRQAAAVLEDIKFDNFKEAAEKFRSIIDQTIEDLNERWDIFDTVRNATGDLSVASRIAGFGDMEANARTSADAMRNQLKSLLRDAGGENLLNAIPLNVKIDEESLREKFEQAIPQTGDVERYKEKIDGLIKAYQEWQKLQRKVIKDDVSVYANLIGSVVSYDAQINKLQDKLEKQKGSNNALAAAGIISRGAADNANDIAQTQFDWEKMKLSADYANIYNNAIAMSRTEFSDATDAIERMLQKLRELGLISADDYVSESEKLNKARNEWSTTGFLGERGAVGQFISGGYEGLMNYYAERRDKARQQEKNAKQGSEERKRYAQEANHYGKLFDKMSKLSDAAKDVITAFQTLQAGLDLVGGMLDSLGMEGAANAVGDASGVLGSGLQGASALSALGPYGQAAGAGIGLISGLAQVHDKGLERQIAKLRDDVKSIESNTALILQARERTLGFDTGDLRRSYAGDYQSNNSSIWDRLVRRFVPGSKARADMLEYYQRNSSGTGYEQEYKNLIDQRKDYMEILDAQESKKKKSQSDIDETKEKIAELDDQIRHFTQDLAKELFDIDIKGWADQLSDALASAFENGEDMAKAYRDTVTNILQQVMNKMMQMSILEPMFQSLQDKLFGNAEKKISGVFDPSDPQGSMGKVTSMITDFFGKGGEGEKTITAATEFMAAFQRGVQNAGLTVLNESSGTLSSGVKGMTEETSDLLAGYVNALRQDVSINRILLNQFVAEYWPSYVEEFKKSVRSLSNIDNNTRTIMEMMQNGNGAMYEQIASLRQRFDNVVNGIENLSVR